MDPPTWFSSVPAGATVDARLLGDTTSTFAAGLWRQPRNPTAADAPMVVHAPSAAVGSSARITAFAANPLYRADPEREWPMVADAAYWSDQQPFQHARGAGAKPSLALRLVVEVARPRGREQAPEGEEPRQRDQRDPDQLRRGTPVPRARASPYPRDAARPPGLPDDCPAGTATIERTYPRCRVTKAATTSYCSRVAYTSGLMRQARMARDVPS